MNTPTIGKANLLNSIDTLYVDPNNDKPEPDAIPSYTKEGGITIAYVGNTVNIKSEDEPISHIALYNTSGMKVNATPIMRTGQQFASIPVATLPRGIYIVTASTISGDEYRIKFIIK